jgi:putative isomerase
MMDPARFFATVPLPTLSMARPEFDPTEGYWRGPVWLDQAYFGVRGLERYGLVEEAGALRARLLEAPEGLGGRGPIFENYDPRTGEGLNAPHFSWSAAHLLMLLDASDGGRP